MATEQVLPFNIASVVEDVLQQHGTRLSDVGLASRKAEEACNLLSVLHFICVVLSSLLSNLLVLHFLECFLV